MIHPQHEGAPDSPETKILQLNNDVLDLRNQVLFDRVGEDAMLAAADAAVVIAAGAAAEATPEVTASCFGLPAKNPSNAF